MNPHFIFRDNQVSSFVKFGIYPNSSGHKYPMSKCSPFINTVTLKKSGGGWKGWGGWMIDIGGCCALC